MKGLTIICLALLSWGALAGADPLVVNATEFGVGKFHRADNQLHNYDAKHAWLPFVLPPGAGSDKALTQKNADGSYTIFFSTLEELMVSTQQISQTEGRKVSVFNLHGHGLPGAMWFPKDAEALNGIGCYQWQQAASGSDDDNVSQYYGAVTADEITQIRDMSNGSGFSMPCTTGLKEWTAAVEKTPEFKSVFAEDAQIHFLSCVVGLGRVGDDFTRGMAALLLPDGKGKVETSMDFGLGDWSMPQGMGFWDYQTDEQLNHDNAIYPKDRKDAEIAQIGSVRLATQNGKSWTTSVVANQPFLALSFDQLKPGAPVMSSQFVPSKNLPKSVRIPGTAYRVDLIPGK